MVVSAEEPPAADRPPRSGWASPASPASGGTGCERRRLRLRRPDPASGGGTPDGAGPPSERGAAAPPDSPPVVLRRRPGRAARSRSELGTLLGADGYVRYRAPERSSAPLAAAAPGPGRPASPGLWARLRRLRSPRPRQRHSCVGAPPSAEHMAAQFRRQLAGCTTEVGRPGGMPCTDDRLL
ncbi:hypothetical protein FJT64_002489 [Amphibalanus amphitrite]|uniref:Uncharacterized protein n=1 Tax=Amphibalanus amphitrite TaxID=1232801 RepID=A0A6A4WKX5_AMPAM|nr:hypothetical protein FJT64_002489 [Amphibalanus amphitrite]